MTAAGVSFVIPVLNEEVAVTGLLRDLRRRYPASELIVVDGGSQDATVSRARPLCDQLLLGERGRAQQMNLGARAATQPYLFFLHADTTPGVCAAQLQKQLQVQPQWGFSRITLSGDRLSFRLIAWCMNVRSRLTAVATGDQLLFMHKALFERTGGFDDMLLMEDVACCKRLRRLARPLIIQQPAVTSSRRWEHNGVVRTVLQMWLLRLGYVLGVAPSTLWRCYYGR